MPDTKGNNLATNGPQRICFGTRVRSWSQQYLNNHENHLHRVGGSPVRNRISNIVRPVATVLAALAVLLGIGVAQTATAQPAQAAIGTVIFNNTRGPLWVEVGHHFYTIGTQRGNSTSLSIGENATAFWVPDNICGYWTANYHRQDNLFGGWHKVPRNKIIHVYQLRCPNGLWTEQF